MMGEPVASQKAPYKTDISLLFPRSTYLPPTLYGQRVGYSTNPYLPTPVCMADRYDGTYPVHVWGPVRWPTLVRRHKFANDSEWGSETNHKNLVHSTRITKRRWSIVPIWSWLCSHARKKKQFREELDEIYCWTRKKRHFWYLHPPQGIEEFLAWNGMRNMLLWYWSS